MTLLLVLLYLMTAIAGAGVALTRDPRRQTIGQPGHAPGLTGQEHSMFKPNTCAAMAAWRLRAALLTETAVSRA